MADDGIEWTTDMTFPVGNGKTMRDVAIYIRDYFERSFDFGTLHENLHAEFHVNCSDADLAIDRAMGGVVRALTTNIQNEPDAKEDPIANFMFWEVWNSMPSEGFLKKRKIASGKWQEWNEVRLGKTRPGQD